MGFFKRLFSKKQSKELEQQLQESSEDYLLKQQTEQRQVGHYVLDHCEQIIEAARELGEEKKEYDIVTSYLKDIELLTDLEDAQKAPIRDAAENICKLNQARDVYLNTSKKLSDAQYHMMEHMEADIPDAIRRLQTNETYQTTVRRDMSYLEGEKMQWTLLRSELMHEKSVLKIASYITFSLFFLLMFGLLILKVGFDVDATWGWLIVTAIATAAGFFIFIRYQNAQTGIVRSEVNANHAISLLNKTKIKYVNITNAVDYAYEKYHVKNARELEYQWDQYLEAVREKERYIRTNDELAFYNKKLVNLLGAYQLYDARVWIDQPVALINPNEMSELKHQLLVRRQKLRARIQYNANVVETERSQIDRLMEMHPEYEDEIREIIKSVDCLSIGEL